MHCYSILYLGSWNAHPGFLCWARQLIAMSVHGTSALCRQLVAKLSGITEWYKNGTTRSQNPYAPPPQTHPLPTPYSPRRLDSALGVPTLIFLQIKHWLAGRVSAATEKTTSCFRQQMTTVIVNHSTTNQLSHDKSHKKRSIQWLNCHNMTSHEMHSIQQLYCSKTGQRSVFQYILINRFMSWFTTKIMNVFG